MIAITAYSFVWIMLVRAILGRNPIRNAFFYSPLAIALVSHSLWCFEVFRTPNGYVFSFYQVASLFFWVMNVLVAMSALQKPLKNLFLILIPLTLIAFFIGSVFDTEKALATSMSATIVSHILLSVIAYSLLTIATLQGLLMMYQYRKLKSKHPGGLIGILPPLQTMEKLMFELVGVGFLLLSLSIFSGLLFIEDMFAQHLVHKTVFSIFSWFIYVVILFGRFYSGWQGIQAIRWLMAGFVTLMLAYFGSKLVLEVILA